MHRALKPLSAVVLASLLAVAAPQAVFAHAMLTSSTPKNGATVAAGVSEIELAFSAPLRVTVLHVRDTGEHDIVLKGDLPKSFAPVVKLGVGALAPGAYQVSWTAVGEDGHVMKGGIAFTVTASDQPAK
jgi:methionine-rich copper-binding protein CopC